MADCRERAVRHRLQRRVLGGRPARGPSAPGVASGDRRQGSALSPRNAGHALDYVKAPLFDWKHGRLLPPSGNASSDDLQDLLSLVSRPMQELPVASSMRSAPSSTGTLHKPIDIEFGNTDGLHGIHDIHLNQGNVGPHAGDNGAFHDGGLILAFPDRVSRSLSRLPDPADSDRRRGQCCARLHPDQPDPRCRRHATATAAGPHLPIYLERALINPSGPDRGPRGRRSGKPRDDARRRSRTGGSLDKNARVTPINATTRAGAIRSSIALDGNGVQLGNQGGNLILQDDHNAQVDVVTYTAEDALPREPLRPLPSLTLRGPAP